MLIIFDFDGVLRSVSWEALYKSYIAIIRYRKKDYKKFFTNIDDFKKWYDIDWKKNLDRIGGISASELPKYNEIFHSVYDSYIYLFPWVEKILKNVSQKHVLTILSSSSVKSVNKSLGDLTGYFHLIVGCESVKKIKPNPEGVILIKNKFKFGNPEIVIIGDTYADIVAGKRANIKTGAVKWGGLVEWKGLVNLKPDFLFEKHEDLLTF